MSLSGIDSYITRQDPQHYGGQQEDYAKRMEEVLQDGLKMTQEAVKEKKDLKQLFFTLLDLFANVRHEIANARGTEEAELFGRKRMDCIEDVNITPFNGQYSGFNGRMIAVFQKILKGAIPIKGEPDQKKFIVKETCLGRQCSFEVEVLTKKEIVERQLDKTSHSDTEKVQRTLPFDAKIDKIDNRNHPPKEEERMILNAFNKHLKTIKEKFPDYYAYGRMSYVLQGLNATYPSPEISMVLGKRIIKGNPYHAKSMYIVGKARIEIDSKMYALGEVVTWTYQDFSTDPVERMENSVAFILHQDRFLIDPTLNEIASIFEKAVLWERSKDLEGLKDNTALLRYLFAYAMPFARGSASVGEIFEKLTFLFHDYVCKHNPDTMGDMEAFTAPLWSTFRKEKYDSTIILCKN